jgi:hypothetical protein
LKELALETTDLPCQIISKVTADLPPEVFPYLPKPSSMVRGLRKIRQPKGIKQPKCRLDIDTKRYQKDKSGNQFLLHDSQDEKRTLIFATENNLKVISVVNKIYQNP